MPIITGINRSGAAITLSFYSLSQRCIPTVIQAYAAWPSAECSVIWRLPPSKLEWEDEFEPTHFNSLDVGPFDILLVGKYPASASPFGLLAAAGQVFEWANSPSNPGRYLFEGNS